MKRYQMDKLIKNLSVNGFGKTYSKRVAMFLHNTSHGVPVQVERGSFLRTADQDLDPKSVCMLGKGGGPGDGLAALTADLTTTHDEVLKQRQADLSKIILRKNWKSGMAKMERRPSEAPAAFDDMAPFFDDPGATAWIVGLRPWTWRFGPADWPTPGMPQTVSALTRTICVQASDMQAMLDEGLAVVDLRSYLETPSGSEFTKDRSVLTLLEPGSSIFIPCGYLPVVTVASGKDEEPYTQMTYCHV